MRITFFAGSVVGYVDNPSALLTRGLAHGLALRGHDVRIVEPRLNAAFERTLLADGSSASRHFFQSFSTVQHHSYEQRTGAQMLEWVTREISLIDVAVLVAGAGDELCRWIANVSREKLTRCFLAWTEDDLRPERIEQLELGLLDLVIAPFQVEGVPASTSVIAPTVAGMDIEAGLAGEWTHDVPGLVDPIEAAQVFERAIARDPRDTSPLSTV